MNKKLLFLLGVYASGVATTLLYNKKSPSEIKTELDKAKKSGEKDIRVLFNNFIEIHQNLLEDLKVKLLTKENRELFNEKKDELLSLIEDYKEKAGEIFEEYKEKGQDYAEEGLKKLEKFYNDKLKDLEKLSHKAPNKLEEAKKKLSDHYEDFKDKLKK